LRKRTRCISCGLRFPKKPSQSQYVIWRDNYLRE
jgi:hypothetical protein